MRPACCLRIWWPIATDPVCCAASAPIRRPPRGSFQARAASTSAWPGSCSAPSRCSPRPSIGAPRPSTPILPRPLLDVLLSNDREAAETLRHTSFAQPAIFAVEMGLARLWQSWGIEPDVVLGHSVGQYAAACVAGCSASRTGPGSSPSADGSSAVCRPAAGWWRCLPIPGMCSNPQRPSRVFRSAPTTAATRCSQGPARI